MNAETRTDLHARLMGRMARATGTDLAGLPDADWGAALDACCGCEDPAACVEWLADNPAGAERAPDFCRNARLMGRQDSDAP